VVFILLLRRLAVLSLLLCAGCSAQSNSTAVSSDLSQKVQRQVRAYFNIPPEVDIKLGPLTPSEFPNYDNLTITLSHGGKSQSVDFIVSTDGKNLIRLTKMDLTKDPYAETMKKIDVAGRPVRGNPDAKVTIVNYDDFQCPFCARMHSTLMTEILPQYGDKVKIVYKDYPLSMHPWAQHAANDANCLAKESNKGYWEFADYVHANQHVISGPQKDVQQAFGELDRLTLDIGKKNGADATKLQACVKAQADGAVKSSMAEGDSIGVSATPTMFVNGERLEGALDADEVRAALNQQLLAAGVQPPPAPAPAVHPTSPMPASPPAPSK
jgi:protein-disulfide isomerase